MRGADARARRGATAIVARAAGLHESIDPSQCAIFGGSFPLHRYLVKDVPFPAAADEAAADEAAAFVPNDVDVFIPYGCAATDAAEEDR